MLQENNDQSARLVWQWGSSWYSLPLRPDDVLTLARAVDEEGFPQEGVAWALLQRAAWLRTQGQDVSIGRVVEQYAQPINPDWFPWGERHKDELQRLARIGDEKGLQAEIVRARNRPGKAAKTWEQMRPKTVEVISDILAGKSKSPVTGAVHYWASRGPDFQTNQARKPGMILLDRGYGFGPGRNVFFAVKGSEKFGGLQVKNGHSVLPGNGGLQVASIVPGLSVIIIGGAIGYLAWKWLS